MIMIMIMIIIITPLLYIFCLDDDAIQNTGASKVKQIKVSPTFTVVTIRVQFEAFFTGAVITSWGIFTDLTAAMARIIWITFVYVCKNTK